MSKKRGGEKKVVGTKDQPRGRDGGLSRKQLRRLRRRERSQWPSPHQMVPPLKSHLSPSGKDRRQKERERRTRRNSSPLSLFAPGEDMTGMMNSSHLPMFSPAGNNPAPERKHHALRGLTFFILQKLDLTLYVVYYLNESNPICFLLPWKGHHEESKKSSTKSGVLCSEEVLEVPAAPSGKMNRPFSITASDA